jgi:hypothetical protein
MKQWAEVTVNKILITFLGGFWQQFKFAFYADCLKYLTPSPTIWKTKSLDLVLFLIHIKYNR